MSKLFKNMDFLKVTILVCLIASIGLGVWNYMLGGEFQVAKRGWKNAQRDQARIHSLLKEMQPLRQAATAALGVGDPFVYFEKQLTDNAAIAKQSYTLRERRESQVKIGRNKATDIEQRIDFNKGGKNRVYIPRINLFRALYNCEKNSKSWKLRELKIVSKEVKERRGARDQGYDDELSDLWFVDTLKFASRQPINK